MFVTWTNRLTFIDLFSLNFLQTKGPFGEKGKKKQKQKQNKKTKTKNRERSKGINWNKIGNIPCSHARVKGDIKEKEWQERCHDLFMMNTS